MNDSPALPAGIPTQVDTVVFGASGFIGRWLLLELLDQGRTVAVAVRGGKRQAARLRRWIRDHGGNDQVVTIVEADIRYEGLKLAAGDEATLGSVVDVFNVAGRYQFGMAREDARQANVDGAVNVLRWAARRPELRRLVHLSGYRVSKSDTPYPWPAEELASLYQRLGAYEASKIEGDTALRAVAAQESVPLTLVNPSTVVGHSVTGEAEQYIGLASTVRDLWDGKLPALAGTRQTFVPVVAVDYLARFMAAVPQHDKGLFQAHWVLDQGTPNLPDLVKQVAEHVGVPAPRRIVPVNLVRRLPRALTRVDPETLSFLSDEQYDTASAYRLADTAGLPQPPIADVLRHWADRLVADRFGAAPSSPLPGGFESVADSRTYVAGDRQNPAYVLLHGIPLDGESWHGVLPHLDGSALLADLPGLGRSSPTKATTTQWLTELLSSVGSRPLVIGHSAAAAPVLRYAAGNPDRVSAVVLVSPYFLQQRPAWHLRTVPIGAAMLRRATVSQLADSLVGDVIFAADATGSPETEAAGHAIDSAAANLRRAGVARRTAQWLHDAQQEAERSNLRELLQACPVPVHLIAGDQDPLMSRDGAATTTIIPAAGHNPQLSHPTVVAAAIRTFVHRIRGAQAKQPAAFER